MCMGKNTQAEGSHFWDVLTHTWILENPQTFTWSRFDSQKWKGRTVQSLMQWDNSNSNEEPTTKTSWPFRSGIKKAILVSTECLCLCKHRDLLS